MGCSEWLRIIVSWPAGGVRQQFKALCPMMEDFLRGVKAEPGLEGPLKASLLDEADAVGCWEGDHVAAIVFPTAGTLPVLKKVAEQDKLVVMVNPQWQGMCCSGGGGGVVGQRLRLQPSTWEPASSRCFCYH